MFPAPPPAFGANEKPVKNNRFKTALQSMKRKHQVACTVQKYYF